MRKTLACVLVLVAALAGAAPFGPEVGLPVQYMHGCTETAATITYWYEGTDYVDLTVFVRGRRLPITRHHKARLLVRTPGTWHRLDDITAPDLQQCPEG